jgi:CubicO group peptidase (beta-lactamase class C family)
MTLVDDGLLSLDSVVGTWYPLLPLAKQAITLRQLFSHTSGLPMLHPCLSSSSTTLSACADSILAQPLIAPPGSVFAYGGASMQVAGAIAERAVAAAGAPATWDQLFQQRFAQPLGLTTMSYGGSANPRIAGGLSCDLADLGPVLRMLLAGGRYGAAEIVSAGSLAAMLVETGEGFVVLNSPGAAIHAVGYGFGAWRTGEDANGTTFEAGSMGAFGSVFWADLSRGYGAWLLTLDEGTADASALLADLRPLIRAALGSAP